MKVKNIMSDRSVEKDTKYILVVDDEPEIRQSLKIILDDCGYVSSIASTGKQALQKFDEEQFDLVITDIRMPEMGGLDVIEQLRKKGHDVPILIITAYVYKEMAVRAMQLGASGYLLKPIDFDELISQVEMLLDV